MIKKKFGKFIQYTYFVGCFVFLLTLHSFYSTVFAQKKSRNQPNIVFILTDDHRYDLLGATGNKLIQTPHLDKLASDGILFTNAHVTSAICTPSRASIFLSQFERKHGVNFNSGTSVAEDAWKDSYPVVLRKNDIFNHLLLFLENSLSVLVHFL